MQVSSLLRLPNFSSGFSHLLSLEPDWRWRETRRQHPHFSLSWFFCPKLGEFYLGCGEVSGWEYSSWTTVHSWWCRVDDAELMIQGCWYGVSDGTHISMHFLSWRITPAQNNLGGSAKELSLVRVSNVPCEVVIPSPPEWERCSLWARSKINTQSVTLATSPITFEFYGKAKNNHRLSAISL